MFVIFLKAQMCTNQTPRHQGMFCSAIRTRMQVAEIYITGNTIVLYSVDGIIYIAMNVLISCIWNIHIYKWNLLLFYKINPFQVIFVNFVDTFAII